MTPMSSITSIKLNYGEGKAERRITAVSLPTIILACFCQTVIAGCTAIARFPPMKLNFEVRDLSNRKNITNIMTLLTAFSKI